VADSGNSIVVGRDGAVEVGPRAGRQLADRAGSYELAVDMPGILVMLKQRKDDKPPSGPRVIMAGEIISRMTMLEAINSIANAGWRGNLAVHGRDNTHRVLSLDQGALKVARSNHSDDRLGEVLYRKGALTRMQLEELLEETGGRRIGQRIIEKGILDQESLFEHLKNQASQIFFGSLLISDGVYVFTSPDESAPPPAHTAHIPVQGLLMEGVQRIDEMALFRERVPNTALCPVPVQGKTPKKLDETAQTVLMVCDGTRSIDEIARKTGIGEFLTTKAIYHLLQQKLVELHASADVDEDAVRKLVGSFNDVMRDIFMAVATYGGLDQTRATVSAWIKGSGYEPYLGTQIEVDGSLDVGEVPERLKKAKMERPLDRLQQALHELVAFALFSATTSLPRDQEIMLARDVNRRLKAMRLG